MKGMFIPVINPVAFAASAYSQMMSMIIQADEQASRIQGEFMDLLRELKSGEVSLESLTMGENGFEVIPPAPKETFAMPVLEEIPVDPNGKAPPLKKAKMPKARKPRDTAKTT